MDHWFRPDHSWLDIPMRDRTGQIRHDGGVVTGARGHRLAAYTGTRRGELLYLRWPAVGSVSKAGRPE